MSAEQQYDILVLGAGMVGASFAAALANSDFKVALIDQAYPSDFSSDQPYDLRVSSLNIASERFLKAIGAWSGIEARRCCPYKGMKIWEANANLAATEFDAKQLDTDYLGHIVENRVTQLALFERLEAASNIDLFCSEKIDKVSYSPKQTQVQLSSGDLLTGTLLVAADGKNSLARQAAGIGVQGWDYPQQAMVISVDTELPQQDITWQQFRPEGPLAFLPLSGNRGSLVWYSSAERIKELLSLDEPELLNEIEQYYPDCLGKINKILAKGAYPLNRQHAQHYVKEGVALIGDAAHSIHPLAGQGVNIGILDSSVLAEQLLEAKAQQQNFAGLDVLQGYESKRKNHNRLMMQSMDMLYRLFSNSSQPLKLLRNFSLSLTERISPLKKKAISFLSGVDQPVPNIFNQQHQDRDRL